MSRPRKQYKRSRSRSSDEDRNRGRGRKRDDRDRDNRERRGRDDRKERSRSKRKNNSKQYTGRYRREEDLYDDLAPNKPTNQSRTDKRVTSSSSQRSRKSSNQNRSTSNPAKKTKKSTTIPKFDFLEDDRPRSPDGPTVNVEVVAPTKVTPIIELDDNDDPSPPSNSSTTTSSSRKITNRRWVNVATGTDSQQAKVCHGTWMGQNFNFSHNVNNLDKVNPTKQIMIEHNTNAPVVAIPTHVKTQTAVTPAPQHAIGPKDEPLTPTHVRMNVALRIAAGKARYSDVRELIVKTMVQLLDFKPQDISTSVTKNGRIEVFLLLHPDAAEEIIKELNRPTFRNNFLACLTALQEQTKDSTIKLPEHRAEPSSWLPWTAYKAAIAHKNPISVVNIFRRKRGWQPQTEMPSEIDGTDSSSNDDDDSETQDETPTPPKKQVQKMDVDQEESSVEFDYNVTDPIDRPKEVATVQELKPRPKESTLPVEPEKLLSPAVLTIEASTEPKLPVPTTSNQQKTDERETLPPTILEPHHPQPNQPSPENSPNPEETPATELDPPAKRTGSDQTPPKKKKRRIISMSSSTSVSPKLKPTTEETSLSTTTILIDPENDQPPPPLNLFTSNQSSTKLSEPPMTQLEPSKQASPFPKPSPLTIGPKRTTSSSATRDPFAFQRSQERQELEKENANLLNLRRKQEREIRKLKTQLLQSQNSVRALTSEKAALTAQVKANQEEIEQQNRTIRSTRDEVTTANTRRRDLLDSIKQKMEAQLAAEEEGRLAIQKEQAELEDQWKAVKKVASEQAEKQKEMKQEQENLDRKMKSLQQKLHDQQTQEEAWKRTQQELQNQATKLQQKLQADQKAKEEQLKAQQIKFEEKMSKIASQLTKANEMNAEAKTDQKQMSDEIHKLEQQLARSSQRNEADSCRIEALEEQITALQEAAKVNNSSSPSPLQPQSPLPDQEKEFHKNLAELTKLRDELATMKKEMKVCTDQIHHLRHGFNTNLDYNQPPSPKWHAQPRNPEFLPPPTRDRWANVDVLRAGNYYNALTDARVHESKTVPVPRDEHLQAATGHWLSQNQPREFPADKDLLDSLTPSTPRVPWRPRSISYPEDPKPGTQITFDCFPPISPTQAEGPPQTLSDEVHKFLYTTPEQKESRTQIHPIWQDGLPPNSNVSTWLQGFNSFPAKEYADRAETSHHLSFEPDHTFLTDHLQTPFIPPPDFEGRPNPPLPAPQTDEPPCIGAINQVQNAVLRWRQLLSDLQHKGTTMDDLNPELSAAGFRADYPQQMNNAELHRANRLALMDTGIVRTTRATVHLATISATHDPAPSENSHADFLLMQITQNARAIVTKQKWQKRSLPSWVPGFLLVVDTTPTLQLVIYTKEMLDTMLATQQCTDALSTFLALYVRPQITHRSYALNNHWSLLKIVEDLCTVVAHVAAHAHDILLTLEAWIGEQTPDVDTSDVRNMILGPLTEVHNDVRDFILTGAYLCMLSADFSLTSSYRGIGTLMALKNPTPHDLARSQLAILIAKLANLQEASAMVLRAQGNLVERVVDEHGDALTPSRFEFPSIFFLQFYCRDAIAEIATTLRGYRFPFPPPLERPMVPPDGVDPSLREPEQMIEDQMQNCDENLPPPPSGPLANAEISIANPPPQNDELQQSPELEHTEVEEVQTEPAEESSQEKGAEE